ncbi:HlyD family efflux transporter periplasmic adaptor subunit [uncultured Winogradskyella sp.]|uniref:efflux RND transporter periplasmic adaptor subunit n=1 Tax=uncultured Winogradskyella sp. TaxID=395353 RepID=UPI00263339BC|nr:HlyD family efflux transporter periplasmic adaptor subunit [uncultured Winogradskyella sp.]
MRLTKLILVLVCCLSCTNYSEKTLPKEQELIESVYASATVQPDSLYQVYASVSGILDNTLTEEGELVRKNQALFQIINNAPKLNTYNSKLSFELAKQNYYGNGTVLNSIKDEINATKLKFKNDSINYYRQANLWNQNIGSKAEYDSKKLSFELSQSTLNQLQNKYQRTEQELRTALKQAQNNYQSSLINTKDFTVKSKIKGKIYAIYKEPGEIVTTIEPLASIGSSINFVIELLVDEVDIVRVNNNQEVLITLDAYSGKTFKGKISKIYPDKDKQNQTFKVEAIFKTPPKILYPGLSGEANIVITKKKKVLTIPKAYIIDSDKVKTDNGEIIITTGLQNMEYVEVLSGLTKDTYIYKPKR